MAILTGGFNDIFALLIFDSLTSLYSILFKAHVCPAHKPLTSVSAPAATRSMHMVLLVDEAW